MSQELVVRREGFLGAAAVAALVRAPEALDTAPIAQAIEEVFGARPALRVTALALGPGEDRAELLPSQAKGGVVLDLAPPGWRSEWGGLLLFQPEEGLLHGYRPVPGALTLFMAQARPMISMVMLRAPPRVALLGWWA